MFCFRKGSIFWCIVGTQPLLSRLAKFVIKVKFIPDKILEFCNLLKIVNFTHSYVLSYHYKDVVFLNKISIIRLMNVLQNFIFKQFLKYIQHSFWLDFYMSFVNKLLMYCTTYSIIRRLSLADCWYRQITQMNWISSRFVYGSRHLLMYGYWWHVWVWTGELLVWRITLRCCVIIAWCTPYTRGFVMFI